MEYKKVSFSVSLKGFGGSALTAAGALVAVTGAMLGGGGGGQSSSPAFNTIAPRVTSSSKLIWKWSFVPRQRLVKLCLKKRRKMKASKIQTKGLFFN